MQLSFRISLFIDKDINLLHTSVFKPITFHTSVNNYVFICTQFPIFTLKELNAKTTSCSTMN